MAYQMTPSERRARALALKQQRENRNLYQQYLTQKEEYDRRVEQERLNALYEENKVKNQNFFVRAGHTIGDIAANVITGAVKGLEGIYDLGAGIVGAVGGIFDKGFQDDVKKHISYDWTMETFGNDWQEALKYSYTKNGGIVESVASGIGQMLPSVAVTIATGGAGAPAAVSQMASLATLGASAAGNATEQAYNDGASYWGGLGYGLASGAVEMATEKMFGGATKALTGAGLLDGITRSVADTGIKRIAKNALEEGVEEIASELVNPLLKSIYKGKDALSDYTSTDYWKGVGQAGIVGSLTALAYSGTVGYGLSKLGVGYVGKEADIADSLSEIATLKEKGTNLQASGKLNEQAEIKIADTVRKNYQNIESVLKKASPDKRATLIKKFSLEKAFSSEGAMSEKLGSWLNATQAVEQTTEGGEKPSSELASPKKEYYSFGLRGSEQTIQSDLQRMSEDRRKSYAEKNGVTIEEATEKVGDIKVFDGEMSKQAQERFTKMKKGLNILNKMGDNNVSFVVTEANEIFNGTMVDGRTMYIAADTFENDTWAGTLVHEYTHFAEGTKEYGKLFDYLQSDDIQVEGENGEKVQLWRKAQDSIFGQDYGLSEDEVGRIKAKIDNGEALTEQERRYYNEFASEVGARMSEYLLGNETFIDKVVAKDSSIARKFITKIQNLMKMFKRIGSDTKAEFKQLKKAEKLYLAAARKDGNQALIRKILKGREERGEDTDEAIDASPQSEYNGEEVAVQHSRKDSLINRTFPTYKEGKGTQANELSTRWAHRVDIQAGDKTAVSFNGSWYLIEKFDDSEWGYQIIDKITEQEYLSYEEEWNNGNRQEQSIQKGVSRFTSLDRQRNSSFRGKSNNDVARSQQRGENQEVRGLGEEQSQRRETQSDRSGDSEGGGSSKQGIKYSLKIGDENISGTVEETKNLVALHNLSAENLKKVLELGGFPMPSIAVTKPTLAHDNFGEITVIFGKETIDPRKNSQNKVFSRDAWTPVVPGAEYKPNAEVVEKLHKKYYALARKYSFDDVRPLYKFVNETEEALQRNEGEANIIKSLYENTDVMQIFLLDTMGEKVSPIYNETITRMSEEDIIRSKALSEALGESLTQLEPPLFGSKIKKYLDSHRTEVIEALAKAYAENWGESGSVQKIEEGRRYISEKLQDSDLQKHIVIARRYLLNGVEKKTTEYDSQATQSEIRKRVNIDEYHKWVDSLFKGIEEKKGVRNDVEIFDKRGNRRSYEALHEDYTLQNIVEVMRNSEKTGGHIWGGITPNALAAKLSKEFTSISEMKKSADALVEMTEEAKQNFNSIAGNMIDEIARFMVGEKNYPDLLSRETAMDGARAVLGQIADKKLFTLQAITNFMRSEYKGIYDYTENIGNKIVALFEYVKQMTETDYFEAKPRRAVGFDEIKEVLLPRYTDEKLIEALKEKGIKYRFYDGWEGGERAKIVQSIDNVKFSRKDSQGRTLSEGQQEYFKDSKVRDSKGNLLVMYHGTNSRFFTFNMSKRGSNGAIYGVGYYFISDKDSAKSYGKNIIKAYLNIKKPVSLNAMTISQNEWGEYLQYAKEHLDEYIAPTEWQGNTLFVDSELRQYLGYTSDVDAIRLFINGISGGNQAVTEAYLQMLTDSIGYDGVFLNNSLAVTFNPNQIKLTDNLNPTTNEDIRFSRKIADEPKRTYYHLSDGQIKKMLANSTRYKVYTKADAEGIINNVLQNYMSFGEKYGDMSSKTKAEVVDMLWKGLNSAKPGYQMSVALNIADYIIQNSILESLYGDMENGDVQQALDIIGALKPYLHNINLDSLKGEIKYKYDKDNSAYLLWGKRKGERGYGANQIAQELQERGIFIDAINEAEIFFEIDAQYRNAVKALKKRAKEMLSESLSKEQQKELRQEIAREVLRGFDYTGKPSQLAGILDKYRKQISTLYEKLRDSKRYNRATNRLLDKVQQIKNWKTGAFVNSSKYRPQLFKGSIERLAMIKNRGNLNQSGTRRILAGLAEWYAKDNPILGFVDDEHIGLYNGEIASILQAVAQNQKPLIDEQVDLISYLQDKSGISDYKGLLEWYTKENLKKGYSSEVKSLLRELASETTFTTEELIALEKVVGYFGNLVENYNKVIRNGKYVDAKPIAERYVNTLRANKTVKVGWIGKFFDKVFNNGKASYLQTFADPMTVARYMDKYENGFYSERLAELRAGGIKASVLEMNIRQPLEEFLSKHKKYGRGVSQRTIKYKGVELPALDAFLLYMTMNREQALGGLAEAGFAFNNGKETIGVDGFAKGEELTLPELRERAKAEQDELYKQFTEEDREYISIAEKIFNEDCKEAKQKTDIERMGYSNVIEGYYIPIDRNNGAITVDSGSFFDEMNRVSNASFNKDTVQGAKGELYIEGLDEVLDRHIHGVSQYAGLATVIDQYDILYNLNMSEDANKPITVRTEGENTWAKGNDYFKKLISDLQGISPTRGGDSKLFGFFRGHYATYQLGLNPKVWFTQLSSFFASGSILDYSSILKGLSINAKDVDEYCQLAAVRNNDNSAAMAQGVMEKVDKVGSALMKPIGMVDRFVIKKLFGACQVQVEKDSGFKVGTEENKKKAGELLEKVIVETQQNSMATERSAAMRSGSELMKTLTMFTADSMKVFGRVVDSFGEVSVLKHKIKETTDPKVKESLQAQLKAANKKARKSVTALAATAIFMALVAQAFRWLYDRDDDDESVLETMTVDAIGNLMGGLPLIKDIYAKLTEGYDLNNYAYSAINDLFDAFASIVNFSEGKPAQKVKNIVYAVGQIFGIPTRNVYNIFYGLTKRFSPTTAYEIDNVFYNKNYASDLQKAIDNDDEDMIATITGLMLDEKVGGIDNSFAREEMDRLVKGGYQVIPKSIGSTISYEGEEVEITSKQRERFKKVYGEANKALASLVNNKSYASTSDEVKAKAVRFIYDIYYNLAIEDLLGVELETKNILFAKAIDISSLAIIVAMARSIEADTDKKGNIVSGSRKKKVQTYINSLGLKAAQKYMIMGYLGYSNKNGQQQVKSYIQRLSLTKSEKEKLYEYSGYAA